MDQTPSDYLKTQKATKIKGKHASGKHFCVLPVQALKKSSCKRVSSLNLEPGCLSQCGLHWPWGAGEQLEPSSQFLTPTATQSPHVLGEAGHTAQKGLQLSSLAFAYTKCFSFQKFTSQLSCTCVHNQRILKLKIFKSLPAPSPPSRVEVGSGPPFHCFL